MVGSASPSLGRLMFNRKPTGPHRGRIGALFSPKRRIGSPILLQAIPTQRGRTPFFCFGLLSDFFRNILASRMRKKAQNTFGHNALTGRTDPHAVETPMNPMTYPKNPAFCILLFVFVQLLLKASPPK